MISPPLKVLMVADALETLYVGRLKSQPQGKNGSRGAIWFVSVTHPDWIQGVDRIGASVWLHPSDSPRWVHAKRDNLRNSLLALAEQNHLTTDGLDAYLRELLQGVGA